MSSGDSEDSKMTETTIQAVLSAVCLGFSVTGLAFLIRNKETDRKDLLIGSIIWAVSSASFFLFFKNLL